VSQNAKRDPWGLWYKIAARNLRSGGVVAALRQNSPAHETLEDTLKFILDALVPSEPSLSGESGNFNVNNIDSSRKRADIVPEADFAVGFSAGEVLAALRRLRSGKASGPDFIPAEMLKRA